MGRGARLLFVPKQRLRMRDNANGVLILCQNSVDFCREHFACVVRRRDFLSVKYQNRFVLFDSTTSISPTVLKVYGHRWCVVNSAPNNFANHCRRNDLRLSKSTKPQPRNTRTNSILIRTLSRSVGSISLCAGNKTSNGLYYCFDLHVPHHNDH